MTYLYVCRFSNGFIKVGRSADPSSRIAQHADRVSCVGVEMTSHKIFECASGVTVAESALIKQCVLNAAEIRGHEWFFGLDYERVCNWATQCAAILPLDLDVSEQPVTALECRALIAALMKSGLSQSEIANRAGVSQSTIAQIHTGRRGKRISYEVVTKLQTLHAGASIVGLAA
jgi:hypothetical protein